MANLRSVNTHFWSDNYIADLDPIEKLLFLYLITNPLTTLAGCYEVSERRIAFDTGIDKDMVVKILERFENSGKLKYRKGWIVLTNFLENQSLNENMRKNVVSVLATTPDWVRSTVATIIKSSQSLSKGFESFRILREVEVEVEGEKESENETETEPPPAADVLEETLHESIVLTGIKKELGLVKLSASAERLWTQQAALAFQNGFTPDEFLECLSLLRSQTWRTSAVKPTHVFENLPELKKLRQEVNKQNGTDFNDGRPAKPTSASRIAEHRTILDQYIPEADLGNIS